MIWLFNKINCIYLYHRSTNGFLSTKDSNIPMPGPIESAIDFKLMRGNKAHLNITLENPSKKSLDLKGGSKGTELIYYSTHKGDNQSFRLVLDPSNALLLVHDYKCLNWNPSKKNVYKR